MLSYLVVFSWLLKLQLCRTGLAALKRHPGGSIDSSRRSKINGEMLNKACQRCLWCHESLRLPELRVEELRPHFPPLKMSVWLQMKHSSVKWNERSRSNCWIETCNYASSFSLSHIGTTGASLEGRCLQSGVQQKETVCSEGSENRTPKVAPNRREDQEWNPSFLCQEEMKTCVVTREDSFILVFL